MLGQLIPAINTFHAFTAGLSVKSMPFPDMYSMLNFPSESEGGRVKNPNGLSSIRVCVCLRSYWYFLLSLKLQFMLGNLAEQKDGILLSGM